MLHFGYMTKQSSTIFIVIIVLALVGVFYFYNENVQIKQQLVDQVQMEQEFGDQPEFIQAIAANRSPIEPLIIRQMSLSNEGTIRADEKGITFLRFEAYAVGTDVALQKVIFEDRFGKFTQAGNFALWVDKDGDGIAEWQPSQTVPIVAGNRLTIEDLAGTGYVIKDGEPVTFELKADASAVLKDFDITGMSFWSERGNDYIDAIDMITGEDLEGIGTEGFGTDGNCLGGCGIRVYPANPLRLEFIGN